MAPRSITLYHSPDADDAFMFYGLASGAVRIPGFDFVHKLVDIQTLNQMALRRESDFTAASVHACAHLKDTYAILRCGGSMGGVNYGPRLVAREPFSLKDGKVRTFATPGTLTSATLATRIYLREQGINAELVDMGFDQVGKAVQAGEVDAGVIIHEGQLTHRREGLVTVLDLGQWWWETNHLPLPLGVNIVRKSLGEESINALSRALRESIEYSLAHRKQALEHALSYGRGITAEEADTFVAMYVNKRTLNLGEDGIRSISLFVEKGAAYGFSPAGAVEFVG